MTTPEEQAPEKTEQESLKEMLETLNTNIALFHKAIKQHNDYQGNSIIHIRGQLINIEKKKVGENPCIVPKYSRQRARFLARKIKNGNGDKGEQMAFVPFCSMALANLEKLKEQVQIKLED